MNINRNVVVILGCLLLMACDPLHKSKCEWYIAPDAKNASYAGEDLVALCLKNFVIRKQRCYFAASRGFAEEVFGHEFVFDDVVVRKHIKPRRIVSATSCQGTEFVDKKAPPEACGSSFLGLWFGSNCKKK